MRNLMQKCFSCVNDKTCLNGLKKVIGETVYTGTGGVLQTPFAELPEDRFWGTITLNKMCKENGVNIDHAKIPEYSL